MCQDKRLLEFPCKFPIKALGYNTNQFDSRIVEILHRHTTDISEGTITSRISRGGKYISVTIVVQAENQQQLDAIYQDLSDCPEVLMAL